MNRWGWHEDSLDRVCRISYGTRVTKKRDAGTVYPVYGGGGATFRIDRYNREDCTIVSRFGMSESCVRHVREKFFLNDSGLSLSPINPNNLLPKYLDYFLFASQKEIYSLGRGSAQKNLDVKRFRELRISYPASLREQKRIVAILDEAFAGIDTAIANTEKNLANARELFEFLLNSIFRLSPSHWAEVQLKEICTIKHGFSFRSKYFSKEGKYILLTPGSFKEEGGFRDQGERTKYYSGEIPSGYILNKGDFLVAMTEQASGLLGSSLVVPRSDQYLHNQRLGLLRPLQKVEWHNDFYLHQFSTFAFRAAVDATASGVKVRHTSPKKLGEVNVKVPPTVGEQKHVADRLNELNRQTRQLQHLYEGKLIALDALKQSLLRRAFLGELTADTVDAEPQEANA